MKKFCRCLIEVSFENEFLYVLEENKIHNFEYVTKTRTNNKTFVTYDVAFNDQTQYELIARNSDSCQLLNFYD